MFLHRKNEFKTVKDFGFVRKRLYEWGRKHHSKMLLKFRQNNESKAKEYGAKFTDIGKQKN